MSFQVIVHLVTSLQIDEIWGGGLLEDKKRVVIHNEMVSVRRGESADGRTRFAN